MAIKPLIKLDGSPLTLTLGSGVVSEDAKSVVKIVHDRDGRLLLDSRAKLRPQVDLNKSFKVSGRLGHVVLALEKSGRGLSLANALEASENGCEWF